jgi:putative DNA-invertase from lambdoid prophage Rac
MLYAYLRVSKDTSDVENQRADILNTLLLSDSEKAQIEWIEETVSGRVLAEDRKLGDIIEALSAKDVLVVSDVSRLGRDLLDVAGIAGNVMKRKARLIFARESWELKDELGSEIHFFALSLAAKLERHMISARTKSALSVKKANGEKLGRPFGTTSSVLKSQEKDVLNYYQKLGMNFSQIAKATGTTRQTVKKFLIEKGVIDEVGEAAEVA